MPMWIIFPVYEVIWPWIVIFARLQIGIPLGSITTWTKRKEISPVLTNHCCWLLHHFQCLCLTLMWSNYSLLFTSCYVCIDVGGGSSGCWLIVRTPNAENNVSLSLKLHTYSTCLIEVVSAVLRSSLNIWGPKSSKYTKRKVELHDTWWMVLANDISSMHLLGFKGA